MSLVQGGMTRSEVAAQFPVNCHHSLEQHSRARQKQIHIQAHLLGMPARSGAGTAHGVRVNSAFESALSFQCQMHLRQS